MELDPETVGWIRRVTGAVDVVAERRSAGASREGWAIDAHRPDGSVDELWLRRDSGHGPQSNGDYTVRREASIYQALEPTAVRVPQIVAVHPTDDAFLATRVMGRNWFSEIRDANEQRRVARDFMEQLAALHQLDPAALNLTGLDIGASLREHVLEELEIWERQYRSGPASPEPIVALALRWLRRHVPGDARVALVQGDTGPGNFVYAVGKVVAVLDWEMAHLGDPHDDLGWICVRDLQERFTSLPDRFRDYERAGGVRVDLDRLRYFRLFAQTRCAIGTLNGLAAHDARGEIANHLIYSTMHLRALAQDLADILGVEPHTDSLVDPGVSARTALYDVALTEMQETIVPACGDEFATRRAKGVARLMKYLREVDRLGAAADAAELEDLLRLGIIAPNVEEGRRALVAAIDRGDTDERVVAEYGVRRMARTTELMRPAMGTLADRRYSPIS